MFTFILFLSAIGQFALGDGRALDHPLGVGQTTNPVRNPLSRPPSPLYDGLGGKRFDDRFVDDGLRFAPEFIRGNSVYHRSLLFEYQSSTGWDLQERRYQEMDRVKPRRQGIERPRSGSAQRQNLNQGPINTRIETRIDTRIDRRVQMPFSSSLQGQEIKPKIFRQTQVKTETRSDALILTALSDEQIVTSLELAVQERLGRLEVEKKIFGDVRDRKLSDHLLGQAAPRSTSALTLLGLSPSIRLRIQLSELSTKDLMKAIRDFRDIALRADEKSELKERLDKSYSVLWKFVEDNRPQKSGMGEL